MNTLRFMSKRIVAITNDNDVSTKINRIGQLGLCTYKEVNGKDFWCIEIDKDFSKLEKILACAKWETV